MGNQTLTPKVSIIELWHNRLGHIGRNSITNISGNSYIRDIINPNAVNIYYNQNQLYKACLKGKFTNKINKKLINYNKKYLYLYKVALDLCRPIIL